MECYKDQVSEPKAAPLCIGWREWISLPGLDLDRVKAKVDTGARTSCLHAFNLSEGAETNTSSIAFDVHPLQGSDCQVIRCLAPLVDYRPVRSSNGAQEIRR